MSIDRFTVRSMTESEVPLAIEWAAREGWNPGLRDAESFFSADPGGFFIGELNGNPVSVISAVKYGHDFGFVGLYIVKPEFRSLGYGFRTWKYAITSLDNRNVGLDAVVEQQKTYERAGFRKAYANVRFGMTSVVRALNQTVPLNSVPLEEVLAYDRLLFPADRSDFMKAWISQRQSFALAIRETDRLAGFGVLRPCRSGCKIGPLFANDREKAEILFCDLASRVPGQSIYLDVPEINSAAIALAERHGMTKVFETGRMYTRGVPELPMERLFGITTFELG